MFDTSEQIESGFSSGGSYYRGGEQTGKLEEIFDYLHSLGIEDFSPKVEITKLGKTRGDYYNFYINFNTDSPYYKVKEKYNQDSYIKFSIWYRENFNLSLDRNDAKDHNFQEIEYVTLENINETKKNVQEKMEKYNISEEHQKDCMKQFQENVENVAKILKKEFLKKLEARENKLDKLFFPTELKEPFKNKDIEIINGEFCLTMPIKNPISYDYEIRDNKSFFGQNEKGYYIGTSTELKEDSNFYNFLKYEKAKKMKFKIYKTFNEFMKNVKELFDKETFENPKNFETLKNFFETNLEIVKRKANDPKFIDKYLNNFEYFNLVKRKSKDGKEFVNYKVSNIILSLDTKNPNMIKKWNIREKKEYPSVESSIIYQKLAKENNFKLNKKNINIR